MQNLDERAELPELPTENLILYDWLSFTSKVDSLSSIITLLGLEDIKFTDMYGMQGFKNRMYFEGISIHYDSDRFGGVWVEMSGKGCRAFETYSSVSFDGLFELFRSYPDDYHVTRLDVAFDDHTGVLPIEQIANDVFDLNFVSRFHAESITVTCAAGRVGHTIDCGSRKSDLKFRIYDKAFERGYDRSVHWVRWEMQLRNDRAYNFIRQLTDLSVGILFRDVIINYIRFVTPEEGDSNKKRWQMRKYFADFLGDATAISLYTPKKVDYNLAACEDYVYKQCGNSLDTLITIKGVTAVLKELRQRKPARSVKYKDLISANRCIANDPIIQFLREQERIDTNKRLEYLSSLVNRGVASNG